ncbi:MAG: hypothetical protein GY798_16060, partial [Hyphomicrobiales bacterium]|nr:hypothetical protein [Hyphomicrobiales bacterium]
MSRISFVIVLLIASLACVAGGPATAVEKPRSGAKEGSEPAPVIGTVYVFRPMGGRLATPEMDKLARRIKARGLEAEVHPYADWIRPANAAIARYQAE